MGKRGTEQNDLFFYLFPFLFRFCIIIVCIAFCESANVLSGVPWSNSKLSRTFRTSSASPPVFRTPRTPYSFWLFPLTGGL
jgi:hypothetical protein